MWLVLYNFKLIYLLNFGVNALLRLLILLIILPHPFFKINPRMVFFLVNLQIILLFAPLVVFVVQIIDHEDHVNAFLLDTHLVRRVGVFWTWNRNFVSRDVIFVEHVFPFTQQVPVATQDSPLEFDSFPNTAQHHCRKDGE